MAMFWQAFPDLRNDIQDMIIEGDTVVLRLAYTATHLGEFQGIPPTGKQYTMLTGSDISRYENGLVKEEWLEINMLPMLQAMGAIPGTPPA
jgi:predicted ester cyclase